MHDAAMHQVEPPFHGWVWVDRASGWMRGRERTILLSAAAFQILVLLAMIALRAVPLVVGENILLRVAPVDPRELFRGEYVMLSYDFSRIPSGGIEGIPQDLRAPDLRNWQGRTVYVSLVPEPDGKHWRADKVSIRRPAGGKHIRGRIIRWGQIEFGIEAYYVQEGKGREYEAAVRDRRLSAEVAVTPGGSAALLRLWIE